MSRKLNSTAGALATLALLGCDSQVDSNYQGESLLRINGSVVIPEQFRDQQLVLALVFPAISDRQREILANDRRAIMADHERILDVAVQGSFPSGFTLDVFDPAPPEAMGQVFSTDPPHAMGFVVPGG